MKLIAHTNHTTPQGRNSTSTNTAVLAARPPYKVPTQALHPASQQTCIWLLATVFYPAGSYANMLRPPLYAPTTEEQIACSAGSQAPVGCATAGCVLSAFILVQPDADDSTHQTTPQPIGTQIQRSSIAAAQGAAPGTPYRLAAPGRQHTVREQCGKPS
jgi:hypothetical protein